MFYVRWAVHRIKLMFGGIFDFSADQQIQIGGPQHAT